MDASKWVKLGGVGSLVLIVAMGVSSCSAASQALPELPAQDRAHMVLPLDSYHFEPGYTDYVEYIWEDDCAMEKGFNLPKAIYNSNPSKTMTNSFMPIFNAEVAAEFGYGQEQLTRVDWNGADDPELIASMDGLEEVLATCAEGSSEYFGITNEIVQPFGASELPEDVEANLAKLAAEWVTCMAPQGIADLPDTPVLMPSESISVDLGVTDADGKYVPSATELKVALADAACRESSGWAEARYQALWDADLAYIEAHKQELGARKAEMTAIETKFNEYMAGRS